MTYLSGNRRKGKGYIGYTLYIGIVAMLIIFWTGFKSFSYVKLEPLIHYYADTKISLQSIPEFFATYTSSRTSLIKKAKTLEITIENLENTIAEKDAKLQELGMSLEELGDRDGSILVMYPLVNDITRIYSTLILSKGYKDGVEKDAYVYVRGLQPVCVIKEVYPSSSLCELLSASGVVTEAVVISGVATSTITLPLLGRGGGAFLGDVARGTPIAVGDKVALRGDLSMTIGTVVNVLNNNQDTSWRVFVRGVYNPVTSSIFYLRKK